jgi:hypothetical protein
MDKPLSQKPDNLCMDNQKQTVNILGLAQYKIKRFIYNAVKSKATLYLL